MHILTIQNRIDQIAQDNVIEPGTYYCEDTLAAQMMYLAGGGQMEPLRQNRIPQFGGTVGFGSGELMSQQSYPSIGHNGLVPCTSILIGRTGGLGDLTLLTPVLREIKRRWPSVRLAVASIKELQQSIQNLPFIDELLQYPVSKEKADTFDGWIWLENAIEKNEDAKTLHSVDCIAKFIGLELPADCDKRQAYVVTEDERNWVKWAYPRINGVRRLCIQTNASGRARTYPMPKTGQVIAAMLAKKWEVFLLGAPGEIKVAEPRPGLRIVSDDATFRQRAALIETADCFFGPDSSLTHIAGALEVPAVALYGPFPWQVRTAYNPTTHPITGTGFSCNPCFHHAHLGKHFPDNCPTRAKGICGVLDAVTPEYIVKKIEEIALGAEVVQFAAAK